VLKGSADKDIETILRDKNDPFFNIFADFLAKEFPENAKKSRDKNTGGDWASVVTDVAVHLVFSYIKMLNNARQNCDKTSLEALYQALPQLPEDDVQQQKFQAIKKVTAVYPPYGAAEKASFLAQIIAENRPLTSEEEAKQADDIARHRLKAPKPCGSHSK